jgi:hypothetical protein
MDVVKTLYKELFNIKLVHPAYGAAKDNDIFKQLTVTPDKATQALFARHEIGYRCIYDSIVCFIRSELMNSPAREPKKPFVLFEEDFTIRFLLSASSGFFKNTYVSTTGSKNVYYFTNKISNVVSSNKYISKSLQSYDSSKDYDEGTIVNNGGEPYASLRPVDSADAIAITNTTYWKKVLPFEQAVNNADIATVSTVKNEEPCFAVIDISNIGTTDATYNLFATGQQLLSPVYTISFKSKI